MEWWQILLLGFLIGYTVVMFICWLCNQMGEPEDEDNEDDPKYGGEG